MSIFGVLITYACSWWLVLFMVLPWKTRMAENPVPGQPLSAPDNPQLKKKLLVTTGLAILPTLLAYILIGQVARAAEPDMYSTKGSGKVDCGVNAAPSADVRADDDSTAAAAAGQRVGIYVPSRDYGNQGGNQNVPPYDGQGTLYVGDVGVNADGTVNYRGQKLGQSNADAEECN